MPELETESILYFVAVLLQANREFIHWQCSS